MPKIYQMASLLGRNRRDRYRKLNDSYAIIDSGGICYYCGDNATDYDHVPPLKYVDSVGTKQVRADGLDLFKVQSCLECNTKILMDRPLLDLHSRVVAVYDGLQKRHRKILAMPAWENDELEELGFTLRSNIEGAAFKRRWIEERLQFIEDVHDV